MRQSLISKTKSFFTWKIFSKKCKKYIDILLLWVYNINIAREHLQKINENIGGYDYDYGNENED